MKKALSILLAAMMSLTLLASCGEKPAASTPAASTPAASTPAESTPAAPAGKDLATPEAGAELVYWTMWNETEPQGKIVAEAAEAFTAKTGVKIDVNFNGRDIRKSLEPALAGGEVVDIFDEDIERVLNTWGKYLLPLDEYVAGTYDGKVYRDQVNKTLIDLAEKLGGGSIKNIPYQPSTMVVMYNKDLFEKAGVKETPKTWDEFMKVCEQLKAAGTTPITVDDAYMAALFGYNMDRLVGADKTLAMVKDVNFSDPAVLEFAKIWEDMAKKGYISKKAASNVFPAGQIEEVAKGTVAMYLNGTWLPNEIKGNAPDMKWGSFAWPAMKGGDGPEANNFGSQSYGINKDTKYPNAAFAFVRWMTTGEWDQKLADESLGVPMANDAKWPVQTADAKAIIDSTTKRIPWACGMEDVAEVNAAIKENFAKLVKGDIDAKAFADNMAKLKKAA
ncbi:MAG: extracellular solute-binding protein [Oscillospiraceae bacterium]